MNKNWLRRALVFLVLATLLYFALRNAPLNEIWDTLRQLRLWQIAILVLINVLIYALITLRWWIIVRAENKGISYIPLLAVRLAVFGVSYFTLGPQVGGEPLQVLYLQRKYGLTYTRATASVLMDKLLEFLANFFLLAVGLTAIFQAGILSRNGSNSLVSLSGVSESSCDCLRSLSLKLLTPRCFTLPSRTSLFKARKASSYFTPVPGQWMRYRSM